MGIFSRAVRYLVRQRVKACLLFGCFLIAWGMVLCCTSLLRNAKALQSSLEEKTGSKVILTPASPFSERDIDMLSQKEGVISVNATSKAAAQPLSFSPVPGPDDGSAVTVWVLNDPTADGPFAQEQYRLLEGDFQGAVVNDALGLSLGETILLQSGNGQEINAPVTGLFSSGSERLQPDGVYTENRLENQIFLSPSVGFPLVDGVGYCSVSLYTAQPDALAEVLESEYPDCSVTASGKLLKTLTAPVRQVIQLAGMMLILTAAVAGTVISLLLSLWMRTRQKEFAILLALGYSKFCIFVQAWVESLIVMLPAALISPVLSGTLISRLLYLLLPQPEYETLLSSSPRWDHFPALAAACCGALAVCVTISLLPCIIQTPREILSKMED